ncbi:hypothetical protein LTR53_008585 [Teratosphaeriaceae sp. CCFEE 6253]|nr:hypothetical protein LTR53_008585 [Teratosphaeriaceae sp. CCFEE 6253]
MLATNAHIDASSNGDAAQTVAETVMAEQVGDNVVIDSVSASASAPADVAANPITAATADDGHRTIDDIAQAANTSEKSAEAGGSDAAVQNGTEMANGVETAGPGEDQAEDGELNEPTGIDGIKAEMEGSEQKKEEGHHVRTSSVKKPTTFSKVSATRSFMAKSATPVPAATANAKLSEKPSALAAPAQLAAAKPRLISKSASTLQSLQRPRPGAEGAGAPDASKVWNKNRPVPPAPPKHFTDEELKQQYGIHLATRLQTDEGGKESKWADIDEDEDDWAPEAVVWMDGTKSTLTPAEATAVEQAQLAVPALVEKPADVPKPILTAKPKTELGPQKTILKPGTAALHAKQQPNGSTGTGAVTDKPSLKSKSPAPTPAKSPWAPLPPVDTSSLINPPVQQAAQPAAMPSQDARSYEPQPPSQPAREIAADTFDRSWRDGEGTPRELFNSANGRYEPAPEGRRTSIKPDSAFRKPSLLQRSSQGGNGPAEPSAAFQSRTSSQVDGSSWGKRRGSSVSQGSLPSARRMSSVSRPNDLPTPIEEARRQSTVIGHDMRASPVSARGDAAKPAFAQQSAWDQQMPLRPEAGAEAEDPVKAQERIMREKREEAKKRRVEEEEHSAKEKQERLKAKLAALEGSGKSRKEREAEAAAATAAAPVKAIDKPVEPAPEMEEVKTEPEAPLKPVEASAATAPVLEDQTAPPPIPPQQRMVEEKLPSPLPLKPAQPVGLPERPSPITDEAKRQAPRAHLSPRANARVPFSQQPSPYRPPQSSYSSPGDRKQQPFGRSPLANSDAFSGWNTTPSNGNVWGTSGIGNGTFGDSSSFAPHPTTQQPSALPPPPGMGRPPTANRISPQGLTQDARSPNLQPQQLPEQQRAFPPPGLDARPDAAWGSSRNNGPSPAPGLGRQTHLPAPIAPPSRAQLQQQQPPQRQDPISSWNNAAARLPHQYSAEADAAMRKPQATSPTTPSEITITETFNKASARQGQLGAPRKFDKTEYTVHDPQGSRSVSTLSPAPPSTQTHPIGPVPTSSPLNGLSKAAGEKTVRISDGSQNAAHGGMPIQQPPIAPPSVQQPSTVYQGNVNFPAGPLPGVPEAPIQDQSPPPPETTTHPAHSGDNKHPHIKLPPPPPRVKLPPAASLQSSPPQSQHQHLPSTMPQRHVPQFGPPGATQPIARSNEWQARFNGLFNRANIQTEVPPSPPKTPPKTTPKIHGPALAITSSSKALMDDVPSGLSATVSLPVSPPRKNVTAEGFTLDRSAEVMSKPTIDVMFKEELSFGSKPAVRIPRHSMYRPEIYTAPRCDLLKPLAHHQLPSMVDSQVKPELLPMWWTRPAGGVYVKIHGTKLQNSNKLVRSPATPGRKTKPFGDRKPSVQINKGKDGKGSAVGSGSNTPSSTATPVAGSRQASFHKASTPGPADTATPASTGAAPAANAETHGRLRPPYNRGGGGRGHGRGRGRGAPLPASQ